MTPKALYILSSDAFERIYGPPERAEVARLVEIIGPPQTAETITQNLDLLAETDIILSGWGAPRLDQAFLDAAPKLKAIFYGAGTVRSILTPAFWQRHITLTTAYAANAIPVSEYTVAAIYLSLRHFWHYARFLKENKTYPDRATFGPIPGGYESTVGLVSLGMIGRLVARRLQLSDLRLIAYDPIASQAEAAELGLELVSLAELFRQADVVSLHTPWLPETEGLITGQLLATLKPGATFINTARGAVVRENELIAVLQQRPDLWAILDVVYPEPPEPASPFFTLPNVLLTPHIAGSQANESRRLGQYAIAELKRYLAGEPLQWEVTEAKARLMA
jgi:phosphoglycerate dehydrogenase-like enzyme